MTYFAGGGGGGAPTAANGRKGKRDGKGRKKAA